MRTLTESESTIVKVLKDLREIAEDEENTDLADRCTNIIGTIYSGGI